MLLFLVFKCISGIRSVEKNNILNRQHDGDFQVKFVKLLPIFTLFRFSKAFKIADYTKYLSNTPTKPTKNFLPFQQQKHKA